MNREHDLSAFIGLVSEMCTAFKVTLSAEGGILTVIDEETGRRYGILNNNPELGGER